jgi:hypothetical protein
MTSQIKHTIELGDITGIVLECKHCQASLTLKMPAKASMVAPVCPACGEQWSDDYTEVRSLQKLREFLSTYNRLREVLHVPNMGFALKMEINSDLVSSRVHDGKD